MKRQKWLVVPTALAACLGLADVMGAQPNPNNGPRGANSPNQRQRPGQRAGFGNMTPEQRQQFMQQMREEN